MSTKMELSLDDIIKTTPGIKKRGGGGGVGAARGRGRLSGGGGGRGRGGGRVTGAGRGRLTGGGGRGRISGGGGRGAADGVWMHDKFEGARGRVSGGGLTSLGGSGSKITVSNLHYGVSDADIIELFGEIGPIKYASVHYDRSGRSMGKADVVFERRNDAQVAINQYNGVPLDGRAMMITYANAAPVTVVARSPGALRQVQGGRVGTRRMTSPKRGGLGAGGVRGRGRGGARGGGRGGKQKAPTAAELDAELDAYISANPK